MESIRLGSCAAIIAWCLVSALCVLSWAGCGGPAYEYDGVVTGTVTIDGELANTGTVTFHPLDEAGKVAIGRIYPDGSFSMRTGQGDLRESDGGTVVPGEYIVTIMITGPAPPDAQTAEGGPPAPGPQLMHSKYASKETSDLRRTVKKGRNVFDLRLAGAEREPAGEEESTGDEESSDAGTTEEKTEDSTSEPAESASNDPTDSGRVDQPVDQPASEASPSDKVEEAAP